MKKVIVMLFLGILLFTGCNNSVVDSKIDFQSNKVSRSISPGWDSGTIYTSGDLVSWKGKEYRAKWWTLGDEPGTTGEWGVWEDLGSSIVDTEAPTVPIDIIVGESTSTQVSFNWRDSTDNIGVTGYNIYNDQGVLVDTVIYSQAVVGGLEFNTSYTFTITAIDAAGNESANSVSVITQTLQGVVVEVPTGLVTEVLGANEIMVRWNQAVGATRYDIEVDGAVVANTSHPFYHKGLYPESTHTYRVRGKNSDGVGPWSASISATTDKGTINPILNDRVLVGYWETWDAVIHSAGHIPLDSVNDNYNVINIAFPVIYNDGTCIFEDNMAPGEDVPSPAEIAAAQAKGKKVLISIGGAAASVNLSNAAVVDKFIATVIEIIKEYGFDGIDIDIESGLLAGSNISEVSFTQASLIRIMTTVTDAFGPDFMLTMAPETVYVTGGTLGFGGPWGAYLPIIEAVKDRIDWVQMQYYNNDYFGADGTSYAPGSVEGAVAQTFAMIEGFNTYGGGQFSGLRPDQVVIGLPAITGAGNGYIPPSGVQSVFNQVITKYPNLRGLMTWSINWDCSNGYEYANNHGPYLAGLGPIK